MIKNTNCDLPFDLRPISPGKNPPIWSGNGFIVDDQLVEILEYSANLTGWDDNLTSFHEDVAGDNHFIDRASRQHALQQITLHVLEEKPVILEIGCSSGFMLKKIREAKPNAIIIGADVVHEPLLNFAKEVTNIPLIRFDLVDCPLPDNCIDAVVMLNVLEHIEDDAAALLQVKRILKPNGIAIIEVPAGPHLYDIYDKALMHYRRYSLSNLQKLAEQQGFKILKKSHLGFFIYPAFQLVKKRNKKYFKMSESEQKEAVAKNIRVTGDNKLLHMLGQVELFLGRWISYPFGIRCLMTIQK